MAFLIYSLDNNIPITRCHKSFKYIYNNKEHVYYPDFEIKNQIFEIKGRITDVDYIKINASNAILIAGEKIKFYIDYVSNKHQILKTQLYKLYDTYKPCFTYSCFNCNNEFYRDKKLSTNVVFCSRQCSGKYRQKIKTILV